MDDDKRTAVADYLIDSCGVHEDEGENLAEGLYLYLNERGYDIRDMLPISEDRI